MLDRLKPAGTSKAAERAPFAGTSAPGSVFAAGFRHADERANFQTMMTAIDQASGPRQEDMEDANVQGAAFAGIPIARAATAQPHFFSDNLASLSGTLARVQSASIEMRDSGSALTETVIYRLSK